MKEIGYFKTLVESIERKALKEDWGSSDWYSVINSMDKHIDKYGLSPETIMDAAREAAVFWGDAMGHDMHTRTGEEEAIQDCKDGWMRMSERGQQLQRMFAPVDEGISERQELGDNRMTYDIEFDNDDVTVFTLGGEPVLEISIDDWEQLISKYNRLQGSRQRPPR